MITKVNGSLLRNTEPSEPSTSTNSSSFDQTRSQTAGFNGSNHFQNLHFQANESNRQYWQEDCKSRIKLIIGNDRSNENRKKSDSSSSESEADDFGYKCDRLRSDQQKRKLKKIAVKWLKNTYVRSENAEHTVKSKDVQEKLSAYLRMHGLGETVRSSAFGNCMIKAFGKLPYLRIGSSSMPYYGNLRERDDTHDEANEEDLIASNNVSVVLSLVKQESYIMNSNSLSLFF